MKTGATNLPEILTVDQVAGYLQLHRLTVYEIVKAGQLPAARLGRIIRIRREDLSGYLERQRTSEEPRVSRVRGRRGARAAA